MCARTLCSLDTGCYADTVEWCPVTGFESYLVCGTYQLQENISTVGGQSANVRVGNLQLYCLDQTLRRLEKLQSFELGGVLDTKWLPTLLNGFPVLGAVTSDGEVKIFYLKEKRLVEITSFIASQQKLCLSLDWSSKDRNSVVAVSDSGGQISLCQFNEGTSNLCQTLQWTGHQYEAWITAFDAWNSAIVYSGGDDCLLRGWDTRTDCQKPTFTSKRHEMGVSSIQCNLCHDHIMATGSYDENILLWDTRNMKKPLCSSLPGGGVWRIKWHPVHGNIMLTACMYDGFHILSFISGQGGHCLNKEMSYKEQASLAYGADWYRKDSRSSTNLHRQTVEKSLENLQLKDSSTARMFTDIIATCSFYDHALNLWQVAL